jgi:hypothetical protein
MAMKGGDVFASLAGVLHHGVGVIFDQGRIAEKMCRMTKGLLDLQTCAPRRYKQKPQKKSSTRYYVQRIGRHATKTAQRSSTIAWRLFRKKSRFKLALCLTNLPVIISAKASSPINMFPEGVSFDTDSFPIAIDSGSTYCLSDKRSDFEGALTRVNIEIQGITESKGVSKWKGTA